MPIALLLALLLTLPALAQEEPPYEPWTATSADGRLTLQVTPEDAWKDKDIPVQLTLKTKAGPRVLWKSKLEHYRSYDRDLHLYAPPGDDVKAEDCRIIHILEMVHVALIVMNGKLEQQRKYSLADLTGPTGAKPGTFLQMAGKSWEISDLKASRVTTRLHDGRQIPAFELAFKSGKRPIFVRLADGALMPVDKE